MSVELLAAISGVIAAGAYFPEAVKLYRLKEAHDISLITFGIWFAYEVIWLLYGIHLHQVPIVLNYSVGVVGVSSVLGLSLYYDRRASSRQVR
jgi:uncharacterized protein with PQ loop repeat